MNQWSVLNSLRQITAIDDDGAAEVLPLCKISLDEMREYLKSNDDADDPRIIRAAAALAYYKTVILKVSSGDTITSFKAGDVTVSQNASSIIELAEKIRDEAFIAAVPLLRDDNFIFTKM